MVLGFIIRSGQRAWPALYLLMRAALSSFFSMLWSLLAVLFFGQKFWGACVDGWLYFFATSVFISWGNNQYLLKKFNLMPNQVSESFSESFFSRSLLFGIFILFALFAPVDWTYRMAIVLFTFGRFVVFSYQPVIEYRNKYVIAFVSELIGFIAGAIMMYTTRAAMSPGVFMLSVAIAEMVKAAVLLIGVKNVRLMTGLRYFNLGYYIQSFPFFIYGLALVLVCLVDRIYVYAEFKPEDKAFYQVFMNMLVYSLSVPRFLIIPFLKNYYRGKIRLNSNIRFGVLVGGFTLLPLMLVVVYMVCKYLFGFQFSADYMLLAFFFCLPAFIYAPVLYYLVGKNQHFDIAVAAAIITVVQLLTCPALMQRYGLQGAVLTAVLGQWLLMVASLFLYFQEKNAKKIKLIK